MSQHITFTGSARTGQKIMATAAMHGLKKVTLELGGNDAAVVLPDVDPKQTAPQLFQGAMFNTGQVCCAIKRVFVHESQYDEMVDALGKYTSNPTVACCDAYMNAFRRVIDLPDRLLVITQPRRLPRPRL